MCRGCAVCCLLDTNSNQCGRRLCPVCRSLFATCIILPLLPSSHASRARRRRRIAPTSHAGRERCPPACIGALNRVVGRVGQDAAAHGEWHTGGGVDSTGNSQCVIPAAHTSSYHGTRAKRGAVVSPITPSCVRRATAHACVGMLPCTATCVSLSDGEDASAPQDALRDRFSRSASRVCAIPRPPPSSPPRSPGCSLRRGHPRWL